MAVRLKQWLAQFCAWHQQHKKGELGDDVRALYQEARADLSAILVLAQRLEIHADGARQAVRMARAIPVEFDLRAGKVNALTQDISAGGLSALVGEAPQVGSQIGFRLKLGRDLGIVDGRGRVVAAVPAHGSVRMAVAFDEIADEARQRIDDLVFDAVCAEMRTGILRNGQ
ncbi:MAG: PilZ domain-containing protein [Deltaproteobacteria bacterium]|jgi:hypothetical protein|nr:PilZ domain-containing protein [Deltaproteobacteria bacterium]